MVADSAQSCTRGGYDFREAGRLCNSVTDTALREVIHMDLVRHDVERVTALSVSGVASPEAGVD